MTDVLIICGTTEFRMHIEVVKNGIILLDTPHALFGDIYLWMYEGKLPCQGAFETVGNMQDIITFGTKYCISVLVVQVEQMLSDNIRATPMGLWLEKIHSISRECMTRPTIKMAMAQTVVQFIRLLKPSTKGCPFISCCQHSSTKCLKHKCCQHSSVTTIEVSRTKIKNQIYALYAKTPNIVRKEILLEL